MYKHVLAAIDFVWPRMDSLLHFFFLLPVANTQLQLDLFIRNAPFSHCLLRILKHQNHFAYGPINLKQWFFAHILFHCCYSNWIYMEVCALCTCMCLWYLYVRIVDCIIIWSGWKRLEKRVFYIAHKLHRGLSILMLECYKI